MAGVLLLSDGAQRVLQPRADMQQVVRELNRQGVPLFTIPFGKPREQSQALDVAVEQLPDSYYSDLRATYQAKRDRFCSALEDAGFRLSRPQGAYYVMADYQGVLGGIDPHAATMQLIERIGVNGVPGHLFHADPRGVHTIRYQFAVEPKVLDEACKRFRSLAS